MSIYYQYLYVSIMMYWWNHNGNMIIYCSTEQIIYSKELSWIDFKDLLILCLTILQHWEPDKAD